MTREDSDGALDAVPAFRRRITRAYRTALVVGTLNVAVCAVLLIILRDGTTSSVWPVIGLCALSVVTSISITLMVMSAGLDGRARLIAGDYAGFERLAPVVLGGHSRDLTEDEFARASRYAAVKSELILLRLVAAAALAIVGAGYAVLLLAVPMDSGLPLWLLAVLILATSWMPITWFPLLRNARRYAKAHPLPSSDTGA